MLLDAPRFLAYPTTELGFLAAVNWEMQAAQICV